jgi:hypothetical protein
MTDDVDEVAELAAALGALPDLTVQANRDAAFEGAALAYRRGRALHQPALEEMATIVMALCTTIDVMTGAVAESDE